LIETITTTAGPLGWYWVLLPVSPEKTYRGIAIDHALGRRERDEEVLVAARGWLDELASKYGDPQLLRADLEQIQYAFLLAQKVNAPVPDGIRMALPSMMEHAMMNGWSVEERTALLRRATILGEEVQPEFARSVMDDLTVTPAPTVRDLERLVVLQDAVPSPEVSARVAESAAELAIAPNLFAGLSHVEDVAQLDSTVIALYGLGRLATDGPPALPTFVDDGSIFGFSWTEDGLVPYTNVRSAFWGFVLGGDI
jgi:hypothetical protein